MIKAKYDWMYNFPLNKYKLRGEYRSYIANLTQSGTTAPVATIIKDDFGGKCFLAYYGAGDYGIENNDFPFIQNKTYIMINQTSYGAGADRPIYADWAGVNVIGIRTYKAGSLFDDILLNTSIEVRVYY